MSALEYRTDILIESTTLYAYIIVKILFLGIIVGKFGAIGNWGLHELLVLFATAELVYIMPMSIFSNIWYSIFSDVERGGLDYYLLKPINSLFNYSTKKFDFILHFPTLLFPLTILVIEFFNFRFSLTEILMYVLGLFLSIIIMFSIFVILGSLSFWFTDVRFLQLIFLDLWDGAAKYPADIYPRGVAPLFLIIIPIGLLAYAPAYFLVFGFNIGLYILLILVTVLLLSFSIFMWKSGLKQYTSASS